MRVDHHVDLCRRRVEQPVRLDHFQPLVHHAGGIDRNLLAHDPVRVRARLRWRNVRQLGQRRGAERSARRGQQNTPHATRGQITAKVARQCLKNRVVLAVDGQQFGTALGHGAHEQTARHHQGFLVGEQNTFTRARGSQHRTQSRRTDDGRHHRIDFGQGGDVFERGHAVQYFGVWRDCHQQGLQALCVRRIHHHGVARLMLLALRGKFFQLGAAA